MSGIRRNILIKIRQEIDGLTLPKRGGGVYTIKADNSFIDPLTSNELPYFSVLASPETISLRLYGTIQERRLRVNVIGFSYALDLDTDLGEVEEANLRQTLFLTGEELIDTIVQHLTTQSVAESFHQCTSTGGFAILDIGAIFLEHFQAEHGLVYISIPLQIAFTED